MPFPRFVANVFNLALENYLTRFMRYVIDWRRTRKVIHLLQELPDSTLEDIGIRRHDILRLAYTELHNLP